MGADASERERALEARVDALEARLQHVEGKLDVQPDPAVTIPPTAPRPVVSRRHGRTEPALDRTPEAKMPALDASGWGATQAAWFERQQPIEASPVGRAVAISPDQPPENPVVREPWVRLPSAVKLPDLSGSLEDIEARLAGRALAWVGGLALVLGAIFFLSLAFTRGWIGNEGRVLIGLVAGSVALGSGAAFMERGNRLLGHVLAPVGLAIISVSLMGATRLYDLVPVEVGLAAALLSAVVAAFIAIRARSQIVAAFGLISVLAAPPLLGATPDMSTLAFIAVVLFGTTGVALWRSWSWLPPTAFVLSAPQAAAWVTGHPEAAVGLAGMGLFWLLNVVAAGGEEFRRHRDDLSPSSATLLLANVAFLIWAGFVLLSGDLLAYRGFFLVLVALGQLGVGGYFVVRDSDRNLFGLIAIGTGIAALTMAAPIQLGAPVVPVAWSAEAVTLAWVAVRRGHPYSAFVAGVLYGLAGGYLIGLYGRSIESASGVPFVDGPGGALGFFAASVVTGVWLVRDHSLRAGLAAIGLLVVARCVPPVLDPPSTVIGLSVLMVAGSAAWRGIPRLPSEPIDWQVEGLIPQVVRAIGPWRRYVDALLPAASIGIGAYATLGLLALPYYGSTFVQRSTGIPFWHPAGAALAVYLVGLVLVGWIAGGHRLRERLAAVGLFATTWSCLREFDDVALIAAWSALMVIGLALLHTLEALSDEPAPAMETILPVWRRIRALPTAAILPGALAVIHALAVELPLTRFGKVVPPEIPFTDDGAVAALILVLAVVASGAVVGGALARRMSIVVAGGIVAYAIPFEVYAWTVAVLWAGLGGLALVGARLDRTARLTFVPAAAFIVAASAAVAGLIVAPPVRLAVASSAIEPIVALQSAASLGAVALGLVALARFGASEAAKPEPWTRWIWVAAGVTVVYLLSVAVVDAIATQVGGPIATGELRTQGSVALSVLWAGLGVVTFVAGLRMQITDLRHGGLGLLVLSTAKVFLFDLSALDVAYRVISFIVLGLLLLASAWLWQRLQPPQPTAVQRPGSQFEARTVPSPPRPPRITHGRGHA